MFGLSENVFFQNIISVICFYDDMIQLREGVFIVTGVGQKQYPVRIGMIHQITQAGQI